MVLSEAEKQKIEEEEKYRQVVRRNSKPKSKIPLLITIFIMVAILASIMLNGSSTSNQNSNSTQNNVTLSDAQQKEVAKTYCETHKLNAYKIPKDTAAEESSTTSYTAGDQLTISDCENIIKKLSAIFSVEDINKIAKGMIWIDMNPLHAVYSQGYPWDENQTVTGSIVRTQWVYGDPLNNATYLYFEGSDVNSWNTWKLTSYQD